MGASIATGFTCKAATHGRGATTGMYLVSYFFGGLVGTAVLGQLFEHFDWPACVAGIGITLATAAILTNRLEPT